MQKSSMHECNVLFSQGPYSNSQIEVSLGKKRSQRPISALFQRVQRKCSSSAGSSQLRDQISESKQPYQYLIKSASEKTHAKLIRRAKQNKLSFDDQVDIQFTITRGEMTSQEKEGRWYSRQEYEEMTKTCSKQIIKLDRGQPLKDKKYCARGLESHTRVQARIKTMNRSLAYRAVLQEQHRQHQRGIVDEDALAHAYHAASSGCQLWAQAVALTDQKEARNIQEESEEYLAWRLLVAPSNTMPRCSSKTACKRYELARAA